jgi:endonuclease G
MSKGLKVIFTLLLVLFVVLAVCYVFHSCGIVRKSVPERPVDALQADSVVAEQVDPVWMELPASVAMDETVYMVTHTAQMQGRLQRNYTILYDEDLYAALWVAYPLCASHTSSGREESWGYDPHVPSGSQTNVNKGYGVTEPTENYPKNFYARGHQIPNADRSGVPEMMAQTYYSTNMTPQIQNGFNGGKWAKLEEAVRMEIPQGDTLYVVTGAVFEKHGVDEEVKEIVNKNDSKTLPVPNYYWKALLKLKRENGEIVEASTIGFWLPHGDLKGRTYPDYAVSVDQIEAWTGFNLFPSIPDSMESSAESQTSWASFQAF